MSTSRYCMFCGGALSSVEHEFLLCACGKLFAQFHDDFGRSGIYCTNGLIEDDNSKDWRDVIKGEMAILEFIYSEGGEISCEEAPDEVSSLCSSGYVRAYPGT